MRDDESVDDYIATHNYERNIKFRASYYRTIMMYYGMVTLAGIIYLASVLYKPQWDDLVYIPIFIWQVKFLAIDGVKETKRLIAYLDKDINHAKALFAKNEYD